MGKVKCLTGLAALALAAVLARVLAPQIQAEARYQPGEYQAAKESIALSLMGQLQMSVSDLMWLKTLEYLHNGINYRMPSEHERAQGVHAAEFSGMGAGVAHRDGPSLIPDEDRDWRGILGAMNRHIEPWRPGHAQHSDPQELIPWYQALVKFNPHCVQAYTNGAFFMSDFAGRPEMGRDFLIAGAKKNPWSFEVEAVLGRIYHDCFREYENAVAALTKATELGKEEKRTLAKRKNTLDPIQEQLLSEAYLFLARSYTELGQFGEALAVCDEGMAEVAQSNLIRVQKRIIGKHMSEATNATP
jgi:tetratricopeptide (TPR) repeat protein